MCKLFSPNAPSDWESVDSTQDGFENEISVHSEEVF